MKIARKLFSEWKGAQKMQLWRLTLRGGYLRLFMKALPQSPTYAAMQGGRILGWAFVFRRKRGKLAYLFMNVARRHRRRGIARLLVEEALRDFRKIALAWHDKASIYAFMKFKKQHPKRIVVYNWYRKAEDFGAIWIDAL